MQRSEVGVSVISSGALETPSAGWHPLGAQDRCRKHGRDGIQDSAGKGRDARSAAGTSQGPRKPDGQRRARERQAGWPGDARYTPGEALVQLVAFSRTLTLATAWVYTLV